MPKRKKKASTLKQKQSQRQSVVVNIGSTKKSKPRKKSGRGGLPPPSYQHNLAPTFVTNQQIDYTPLISSILHATNKIGESNTLSQQTIQNPITPLSSVAQLSTQMARQMAGEKAEQRRAGRSAGNLQPHPSQADERSQMAQADFESRVQQIVSRPSPRPPRMVPLYGINPYTGEETLEVVPRTGRPSVRDLRSGNFEGSMVGFKERSFK
jgi:hypothetical protein